MAAVGRNRFLLIPLLGLFLLVASALAQEERSVGARPVDPDVLTSKIAEVEASTTLGEEAAAARINLYRRALSSLARARVETSQAETLAASGAAAPAELALVLRAIDDNQLDLDKASAPISDTVELADLERSLNEEKTALVEAESRLASLREQHASDVMRPLVARERLAAARKEQSSTAVELGAPAPADEANDLTEARRWQLEARAYRLAAEIHKLDQELRTYAPRLELLQAKRDLARQEVALGRVRARQLEDALSARRVISAESARQQAEMTSQALEGRHVAIRDLARSNVEISDRLAQRVLDVRIASEERDNVRQQASGIADGLSSTRNRLAIAGLNQVLGQVLVEQRRALPNPRNLKARGKEIKRTVTDVGLEQFQLADQRRELRDTTSYVDKLVAGLSEDEASEIRHELIALAENRHELVKQTIDAGSRYLRVLSELDLAQRQLESSVIEFDDYLERRLLWVRNTRILQINVFGSLPGDVERMGSPQALSRLATDLSGGLRSDPYLGLALVLLLALVTLRSRIMARIVVAAQSIGRIRTDRFRHSIRALVLTVIAAAPLPLVLVVIGLTITVQVDSAAVSNAWGNSLIKVGADLLLIQFFLDACRDKGLLRAHCGWSVHTVSKLQSELQWFRLVFPASRLLGAVSLQLDAGKSDMGGLATIGLVIAAASLSIFLYRLLTPAGGMLCEYLQRHADGLVAKLRPLWLALVTAVLPTLVVLWLVGYSYTASLLSISFMYSIWLVLGIAVLYGLLRRWLMLGYQRLELKAAIERRDAARLAREAASDDEQKQSAAEGELDIEEPEIDFAALDSDSRGFLGATVAFIAVAWLWIIWSPIIPALGVLQEISLWTATRVINGETIQAPVSLADLLVAIVVVIVSGAAARGLPSFVELMLLQHTSMSAGARYTATTLLRYTIFGTGAVVVFSILGASWSKVQWLVAALGVGIGFGLQEIVANFISGLIILFERPVRVGDVVSVGDTSGVVTRINIRATTIRDWDRKELLVPNKEFITGRLLNWTLSDNVLRIVVPVGIHYDSDVALAMKIAESVALENDNVLDDPEPFVVFEGFGDNTINLSLRAYVQSVQMRLTVKSELHREMNEKLKAAGIVIAFPQRDVHLDTSGPLEIQLKRGAS